MAAVNRALKRIAKRLIPAPLMRRLRPPPVPSGGLNVDIVLQPGEDAARWSNGRADTIRIERAADRTSPELEVYHPGSTDFGADGPVAVAARPLSAAARERLLGRSTTGAVRWW